MINIVCGFSCLLWLDGLIRKLSQDVQRNSRKNMYPKVKVGDKQG